MKNIPALLALTLFALFAFASAYAAAPVVGDETNPPDEQWQECNYEYRTIESTDCGTCNLANVPGQPEYLCKKCQIRQQRRICGGSYITPWSSTGQCDCTETALKGRVCREESIVSGTNPCGSDCVLCMEEICSMDGGPEFHSQYICKKYKRCPSANAKQYRPNGECGTEERICCPTDEGLDWSGWARNALCTTEGNIDSEFDSSATLNPGSGGGIKNNTIKG